LGSHPAILIVPVNSELVPSHRGFLLFGTEPLHHVQDMLRKPNSFGLMLFGQAMEVSISG
jgi:hypothetical protein